MNTRVISSCSRVFRTGSIKPSTFKQLSCSTIPRSFSSLSSRLYADKIKRFTEQHEWIEVSDHKFGVVGITDYAQQLLGDVVFVELPPMDAFVSKGDELGAVESVKSASDIYAPMSGQVFEVNEELTSKPSLINKSPEGNGWICKISLSNSENELDSLLTEEQYGDFLATQHDEDVDEDAHEQGTKDR